MDITAELSELLEALGMNDGEPISLDALKAGNTTDEEKARAAAVNTPGASAAGQGRTVIGVEALLPPVTRTQPAPREAKPRSEAPESSDSALKTVAKTAAMVTGIGPVVTGLLKLFGSGGKQDTEPVFNPYTLPQQVAIEAGLASDRSIIAASTGERGMSRPIVNTERGSNPTEIHVNVQAMDSRSFLDHSDDIARAVREAMLRSHNLNDVISEI